MIDAIDGLTEVNQNYLIALVKFIIDTDSKIRRRRMDNDIPYLLLTPGPLTTTRTVRAAMNFDYSTWNVDYNTMVTDIRDRLVAAAASNRG